MKTVMEPANPTRALIERAKEGDDGAFQALVAQYQGQVERLIRSRLGKRLERQIDAADVVQEALLRAFRSITSFTWQGDDSFVKWLTRIATNYLREIARRENRSDYRIIAVRPWWLSGFTPGNRPPFSRN